MVSTRGILLSISCLVLSVPNTFGQRRSPAPDIDLLIAQIVKARDLAASDARLAQMTFKVGSPQYVQSYKLYGTAYANYDGWDAYVASALKEGHSKNLNNNPEYDKIAAAATKSSQEFVQYVEDATKKPETKLAATIFSGFADLGFSVFSKIVDMVKAKRLAASTYFRDQTKWKEWNELASPASAGGGETPKPQAGAK